MPFRMPQGLQRYKDLRIADLGKAAAAEVAIQGRRNFILVSQNGLYQAVQLRPALDSSRVGMAAKSRPLLDKDCF